jgi:hypothetical protein
VDFEVTITLLVPALLLLQSLHLPLVVAHCLCLVEEERFQVCRVSVAASRSSMSGVKFRVYSDPGDDEAAGAGRREAGRHAARVPDPEDTRWEAEQSAGRARRRGIVGMFRALNCSGTILQKGSQEKKNG